MPNYQSLGKAGMRSTGAVPGDSAIRPRYWGGEEEKLVARIIELATQYGRYGYRRITALLNQEGWLVNHKRVQRIWRREGLKVTQKQPERSRLWLNDGSCIRLRPMHKDHVWSYDFVIARTSDGRPFRIFAILVEYTRRVRWVGRFNLN